MRLWVELMLLHDVNDTEAALRNLASTLEQVRPDAVHVVLPELLAELWVTPADDEGLLRVVILGRSPHCHATQPGD